MNDVALKIEGVSKKYNLYDTPLDRLKESLHPFRKIYHKDFYALQDVSFEVKKGETVGIIGKNGSGKSTLLKIITGVLTPTSGSVFANGRILALLELGTGFNPELTGIENIYFYGAIMGLPKEEIDGKLDAILAFADIGDFVNQPVKVYSSGMLVRLAFAVVINIDPEILIVDEALSVGDELFQRKCFSRIESLKNSGVTILFVSHSGGTIVELCDRAVLLDAGEKLAMGTPKHIVGKYQKLIYAPQDKRHAICEEIRVWGCGELQSSLASYAKGATCQLSENKHPAEDDSEEFFDPNLKPQSSLAYESHGAYIGSPEIHTLSGKKVNCLKRGKSYRYTYKVRFDQGVTNVRFGMMIKTTSGLELGGAVSAPSVGQGIPYQALGTILSVEFRFICNLNPGPYFLNAGVTGCHREEETYLHRVLDICMFKVLPVTDSTATAIIDFNCVAEIELVNNQVEKVGAE